MEDLIGGFKGWWRLIDPSGRWKTSGRLFRRVPIAAPQSRKRPDQIIATEMALHVLAYNLTRVMNIVGIKPFLAAIRA
jgi:hypothetical protein